MRTRLTLVALALALGPFLAAPAAAQTYYYPARPARSVLIYPKGLYVGGGLVLSRILSQDGGAELLENGGGVTLYTGLRVNRVLALEAGWTGTFHNPEAVDTGFGEDIDYLVLNGLTADAKIFLNTTADNLEPYLQGGVGLYLLDSTYFGAQSAGTGFQLGGGAVTRLGEHLELGARALYRGLAMAPPDGGRADTVVSALTLEANLTVRF